MARRTRLLVMAFGAFLILGLFGSLLPTLAMRLTAQCVVVGAALLLAIGLARTLREEQRLRETQWHTQKQIAEALNRTNQQAVMRLLDELSVVAQGDLTQRANVGEAFTGAIADAVNYTVGELRAVIVRINAATERVTREAQAARVRSDRHLDASGRQIEQLERAGETVEVLARSIEEVTGHADRSADVARQTLLAAENGTRAVQDSMQGMHGIRAHMQETAKRIKRLGESSQEIGEIVELISAITEQTNVLALNAAIQAAAAGEAGRGFSVVAEEVQRLAERSTAATKQIGSLVRTIQTDTRETMIAMEKSTQGVVKGTLLSDATGRALAEIGDVSREMAVLSAAIAARSKSQSATAREVAENMRVLHAIGREGSLGARSVATGLDELATVANELQSSVAHFKVR